MIRVDFQSAAVLSGALLAAFSTALVIRHFEGGGEALASAPIPIVQAQATVLEPATGHPAQVVRAADGHYWAQARIDGHAVRVLVDTGASLVALTREDARRLGVNPAPSAFTGKVQTASGMVRAAPVELSSVSVSGARIDKVQALVFEDGLTYSLLGMSYLGRLSAFEATPAGLTLRP